MPVTNPSRRAGPRRSAVVVAGLAAALTLVVAAGLGGPAAPAALDAATVASLNVDPAPATQVTTEVTTVYQETPTAAPAPVVVVHKVVPGGGENENEGND
jgi:hypothetical protein